MDSDTTQAQTNTHEPASAGQVFDGVYQALRRQFGSDVEEIQRDDTDPTRFNAAIFGFTVDGVGYSLSVNRTP